jgi:hypothetical protein
MSDYIEKIKVKGGLDPMSWRITTSSGKTLPVYDLAWIQEGSETGKVQITLDASQLDFEYEGPCCVLVDGEEHSPVRASVKAPGRGSETSIVTEDGNAVTPNVVSALIGTNKVEVFLIYEDKYAEDLC